MGQHEEIRTNVLYACIHLGSIKTSVLVYQLPVGQIRAKLMMANEDKYN